MNPAQGGRDSEWTIGRLLSWTVDYLGRYGVEDPRLSAEILLAHAAGCRRIDLYARFERVLAEPQLARLRESVKRAARHEPIAYLVGEKEFFSLAFSVSGDVLIPRPETETLVEWVIDHCRTTQRTGPRLLDIGTGSGCVIIACLANITDAIAVATDSSDDALRVARDNAVRHAVADRLTLVQADRLSLPTSVVAGGFDVLMSNPPYVARDDVAGLHRGVREFEPRAALTDDGDGLSFYRDIGRDAPKVLRPGGRVFVEVGDGQSAAATGAMTEAGHLCLMSARKDRVTGRERALAFDLTDCRE